MFGKPSKLNPTEYNDQIETLVSLKAKLAATACVESFDVHLNENGRIRGRISLRHTESFFDFNNILSEFPIDVVSINTEDHIEQTAEGHQQVVEVRVLVLEK